MRASEPVSVGSVSLCGKRGTFHSTVHLTDFRCLIWNEVARAPEVAVALSNSRGMLQWFTQLHTCTMGLFISQMTLPTLKDPSEDIFTISLCKKWL